MERIQTLINKLQEQLQQNVSKEQMLYTTQLLVAELTSEPIVNENKVSILMPTNFTASPNQNIIRIEIDEPKIEKNETINYTKKVNDELGEQMSEVEIKQQPIEEINESVLEISSNNSVEITTNKSEINSITEKKIVFELNDIATNDVQSLNEKLKENVVEVANTLKDTPVKDLRKAIGINDKYAFINELFSKDESTYERSIKTINNFGTFKEAEQWINRELKTKLFWDENAQTVKLFYDIVKRRFLDK